MTARTWDVVCLALRGRYRCLALDLRGHGDSDWAPDADYRLERYAEDVSGALEQLGLEHAVLVGMSLGGQASLLAAAGNPRVGGLVLVDVGPEPDREGSAKIIRSIDAADEFADIDAVVRRAVFLNPRRQPEVLRESLKHNLKESESGGLTWKYDWRAFAALSDDVLRERAAAMWAAVSAIESPVLIVRGAESKVFPAELAEDLQSRLRDASVAVVEQAGHTVQGDNPAGLARELEPFLERVFSL